MKSKIPSLLAAMLAISSSAVFLTGCGDNKTTTTESNQPAQNIMITANDTMKFNITEFSVTHGQKVNVTLMNVGKTPKLSMGHNFILLNQGTDSKAFADVAMQYASLDYIAPAFKDKVIAHTKTLGPGESETVTFDAPSVPGAYEFICAFPGHYAVGMRGKMIVQ